MRVLMKGLKGFTELFLLAIMLIGSGMSGAVAGGGFTSPGNPFDGGFTGRSEITIAISADRTSVPVNLAAFGANPSFPYTSTITVMVKQDGRLLSREISISETSEPGEQGSLFAIDDLTKPLQRAVLKDNDGIGQVYFNSGTDAGVVTITATAQDPSTTQTVSASVQITVVNERRPATSMTFTGPYVNAVIAGQSRFGTAAAALQDGSYSRVVSVVVNDANGNPTNPNTLVDFYLIDGPIIGYPGSPGSFFIANSNGNPREGGFPFNAPNGNFVTKQVRPFERLVLDGEQLVPVPDQPLPNNRFLTGIRTIESVIDEENLLIRSISRTFNAGQDNQATVPYVIGRAEHGAILSPSFTNVDGVASTLLTYPVSRIGQTAILVACINDPARPLLCGLLNTCDATGADCHSVYLGVTNGSDRTLTTSAANLGPNRTTNVQMCLRDPNFTPLPAAEIRYNIGSAGPATVTITDQAGNPTITDPTVNRNKGAFFTGEGGCTTVAIASSGQVPGNALPIEIQFTSDYVAAPVVVTIKSPGAGKMDGLFNCTFEFDKAKAKCTGVLRLTDDEATPMADVLIALGNVSAAGLYKLTFDPASGAFGKTDSAGQTNVVVELDGPGAYEFPFQTAVFGSAKYTLTVNVPAPNLLKITFTGGAGTVGKPYSAAFLADGGVPPYVWSLLSGQLPPGLSLGGDGSVSGTPTLDGAFSFVVQVIDDKKRTGFAGFTIVIGQRTPLIVTFSGQPGALNAPYSGVVSASGGTAPYSFSLVAGTLPPGLTLKSDGSMSGSPTEVGTFPFTVQAADSADTPATGTGNFIIVVTEGKLNLTLNPVIGTLNAPFNGLVTATGGTEPYTFIQPTGWLPLGLTLNPDGSITGSPTQVGVFQFAIQAKDKNGATGTKNFTITVAEGVLKVALSINQGALKSPFNSLLTATGGTLPYTFKILAGTLPPGLTLNTPKPPQKGGGEITGIPTQAGSFPFVVQATDDSGATGTGSFIITITGGGALTIALIGPTDGIVGVTYNALFSVTGGTPPYHYTLLAGSLPPGLGPINPDTGVLTGTPTQAGTYVFSVQVTDSAGAVGSTSITMTIAAAEALTVTLAGPATGTVNVPYNALMNVTGGTAPYAFTISAGKLPLELDLNSTTGAITGKPTETGTFVFSVKVTDSKGATGTATLTLVISDGAALAIAFNGPTDGLVGIAYNALLSATGGAAPYTFTLPQGMGSLPGGLSLSATGLISGIPQAAGVFLFTVQVSDSKGATGTGIFTITITGGSSGNVGSVVLLANPPQLDSSGQTPVNLTAIARDPNGVLLKDITVTFSASDNGTVQVVRGVTDDTGTATAILTSPGDKANRDILVTASAGNPVKQGTVTVVVVGTTISSSGPNSAVIGSTVKITFTLQGSGGAGIGGQILTITSEPPGNLINPSNPATNSAGQATVEVTANVSGNIVATALGATGSHVLAVATDNFVFVTPDPNPTLPVPDVCLSVDNCTPPQVTPPQELTVRLTSGGIGVAGKTVTFETTRGTLLTPSAVTVDSGIPDEKGKATTAISSDNAGPAQITAKTTDTAGQPIQTQVQINFVATTPTQMTLQATPSTISANVPPVTNQTSTITATVRDAAFNLVKGAMVNFTLTDVTGGAINPASAVTDQLGQASTVYTASSSPSALNGVQIDAVVVGFPVTGMVTLTVAQRALFITLGTGNIIEEPKPITFGLPYSVLVTDTAGLPVANADITLNVVPVATSTGLYAYFKGYWNVVKGNTPPWSQVITARCLNEDLNQNGILDAGEDFNGNGRLDPGNVVTVSANTLKTDASGFAYFSVVYAQQYAAWIQAELSARATVVGSEATESAQFVLPILASKLANEGVSPPGNPSPYGYSTTCAATQGLVVSPTSIPSSKVGAFYSQPLSAVGGTTPYTWTVSAGTLPTGLDLSFAGGVISGTPGAGTDGQYPFTVRVTDSSNPALIGDQPYTMVVNPASPIDISPSLLANGKVGTVYSETLTATGGTPPYMWAVAGGFALPSGLELITTDTGLGLISGTPSTAQLECVGIQAKDSASPAQVGQRVYCIRIEP